MHHDAWVTAVTHAYEEPPIGAEAMDVPPFIDFNIFQ
jgi:hypothetical protein